MLTPLILSSLLAVMVFLFSLSEVTSLWDIDGKFSLKVIDARSLNVAKDATVSGTLVFCYQTEDLQLDSLYLPDSCCHRFKCMLVCIMVVRHCARPRAHAMCIRRW